MNVKDLQYQNIKIIILKVKIQHRWGCKHPTKMKVKKMKLGRTPPPLSIFGSAVTVSTADLYIDSDTISAANFWIGNDSIFNDEHWVSRGRMHWQIYVSIMAVMPNKNLSKGSVHVEQKFKGAKNRPALRS